MNYYIIPKTNCNINIVIAQTIHDIIPIVSYSLIFYLNKTYERICQISDSELVETVSKFVNPYEFIYTSVPGSHMSVSKVNPGAHIFFEILEIIQICGLSELVNIDNAINAAYLSHNHSSIDELFTMLRYNDSDTKFGIDFNYDNLCDIFINTAREQTLELIICEFPIQTYENINMYIRSLLLVLSIIVKNQANNGICIIKIDNIFYTPILEFIFLLSTVYEKMYIIKPVISNITKSERYIVCKQFKTSNCVKQALLQQVETAVVPILSHNELIQSILANKIPYYFINKIEELNLNIGQQQIETYDQIINICRCINIEDKLETLKRSNIPKCITWCEKNKLPHNKFIDKLNIFLNSITPLNI